MMMRSSSLNMADKVGTMMRIAYLTMADKQCRRSDKVGTMMRSASLNRADKQCRRSTAMLLRHERTCDCDPAR